MSEETLVRHCSPTILGMKTGNIFSQRFNSIEEERSYIRDLNNRLIPKGLRVVPLRKHSGGTLIYVYRP